MNNEESNKIVERVFTSNFGSTGEVIKASFRKTVQVKDYETEVVEGSTEVTIDRPITGGERQFIIAMLRMQLEYEAYVNLIEKGMISQTAFNDRKNALADEIVALKAKIEATGVDLSKYL